MTTTLQNDWVRRVLGVDAGAGSPPGIDREQLTARLKSVREDASLQGSLAEIADALRAAAASVKAGGRDAEALVDALEARNAEIARARRAEEARKTIADAATAGGVGVVDFAKARLRLEAARGSFDDAVENLKAAWLALLRSDDFVDDPRSTEPATLDAIAGLDDTVPSFGALGQRIEDALDRMASAADARQRAGEAKQALAEIAALKARVRADPMLTAMENTDAGSFAIAGRMIAALDDVAAALQG